MKLGRRQRKMPRLPYSYAKNNSRDVVNRLLCCRKTSRHFQCMGLIKANEAEEEERGCFNDSGPENLETISELDLGFARSGALG